jgi:hypothetical protein
VNGAAQHGKYIAFQRREILWSEGKRNPSKFDGHVRSMKTNNERLVKAQAEQEELNAVSL